MKYFLLSLITFSLILFMSCDENANVRDTIDTDKIFDFSKTPEQEAVDAIEEILFVADYNSGLLKPASDTVRVYGSVIGARGMVITERHQTVKGYPVISKSTSYGLITGATFVKTVKYVSYEDFANDVPADTRETQVLGQADGSILTLSVHNGLQTTYTFRSPIETINGIKTTLRYGNDEGSVVTESRQNSTLISTRFSYGQGNGSTVVRTVYPDGSWTQTETFGLADGTIRKTTSAGN
jgi:hypothetical protein